jgi:hypothetical protein
MSKECTTHHHACDCREEKFKQLEQENAALRELTSTLGAPNHINIPVEKWRELREDKERLDYMEKNVDFVSWMYCGKPHSWDFRKKIDAKRKEAQP